MVNRLSVALLGATLGATLVACGGVRDAVRTAPVSAAFDAREVIDVLPADRISAITRPTFEPAAKSGDWLDDRAPVIAVSSGVEARAYPLGIMLWHEVVDDVLGTVPIAITYAPLANAAIVYDRRPNGGGYAGAPELRVSGKLYRSDLVLYDRRPGGSETLWIQMEGRAVAGPGAGATLTAIPSQIVSLASFRAAFPNGVVLARPADGRAYGFDPYAGYDSRAAPFTGFIALELDPRRRPMERVVGVSDASGSIAIGYDRLRAQRVITHDDEVIWWQRGARSALDAAHLQDAREVGETGVFRRTVGGRTLGFTALPGGGFRDAQTGSTWDVFGRATAGPLRGTRLDPVVHVDSFWFEWSAFNPGTSS